MFENPILQISRIFFATFEIRLKIRMREKIRAEKSDLV